VILTLVPRACTEYLKQHGIPPLVPIGAIAAVTTFMSCYSGVNMKRLKAIMSWQMIVVLVLCDGVGDCLLVFGSAFPSMRLRDVQIVARLQVLISLVVSCLASKLPNASCCRITASEVACAAVTTCGALLYFVSSSFTQAAPPLHASLLVLASRVCAEVAGLGERVALARGAMKTDVLFLTNAFVPALFAVSCAFVSVEERDVVICVTLGLAWHLAALGLAWKLGGAVYATVVAVIYSAAVDSWQDMMLVANVVGAAAFLELRVEARKAGMSSVQVNLWMTVAFALSALYAPSELSGGMAVGVALMIASPILGIYMQSGPEQVAIDSCASMCDISTSPDAVAKLPELIVLHNSAPRSASKRGM
jgi:hypothetical protein